MKKLLLSLIILFVQIPLLSAKDLPDILVFLSDDHGQLDSIPYGAKDIYTPSMKKLAEDGVVFEHAYIASPACAPSRTAMLTGLMPARNGAEANHSFKKDDIASLPQVLKSLGYETVAFGKVAHGKDVSRHGFGNSDGRHDKIFVEKFLKERKSDQPLCLFVGTHEPHVPWPELIDYDPLKVTLPPNFVDTPETREYRCRYYTDITKADRLLGEVRSLAAQYMKQNLLTIYTSDHGAQWPFGKWNLYDVGIRVPMIASWPGVIKPGTRNQAMVQWIDLLPTLIEVGGGTVPSGIDGKSFLKVLKGESNTHRDMIFTTHSGDGQMNVYPIRAVKTPEYKLILNLHPEYAHTTHIDKAMGRDGLGYWVSWYEKAKTDSESARIVKRYHERPPVEFYDLKVDPYEMNNLANDPAYKNKIEEMTLTLHNWMKAQGDQETVFNKPRLLTDPASTTPELANLKKN